MEAVFKHVFPRNTSWEKLGYFSISDSRRLVRCYQDQVLAPFLTENIGTISIIHNGSGTSNEMKIPENNFVNYVSKVVTK